jgi:hypothetical protein
MHYELSLGKVCVHLHVPFLYGTITLRHSKALVGWLPVFHSLSQTIDMQFLASLDGGRTWWRPERRSAVPFKELGYYGGGTVTLILTLPLTLRSAVPFKELGYYGGGMVVPPLGYICP